MASVCRWTKSILWIFFVLKKRLTVTRFVIYHPRNTGKEVIQKYMSSNHSEVAET